jgi:glycerol-3-phosphate dehydrogenase
MDKLYDVAVIGAGVVGCAIARELARYQLKIVILEKESDVCFGSSKANSGVVHAGFNNIVGSLKARFCVQGNQLFEGLCAELGVPYNKIGKLVIAQCEEDIKHLEALLDAGIKNGIKDLSIIDEDKIKELEPNIQGVAALFSPNSAVTSPYSLTIAYAENAAMNGAEFKFNSEVNAIDRYNDNFEIKTPNGNVNARVIINSAGVFSDEIARMVGIYDYKIYPCRGEYVLLDKAWSYLIKRMIYPVPPQGKCVLGVHITPTIDGNIMLGPTSEFIDNPEDTCTTGVKIREIIEEARIIMPRLPSYDAITEFSGLRAKNMPPEEGGLGDFIIENNNIRNFINLVGIESPGLTASTPIAKHVIGILKEFMDLKPKNNFNPIRSKPIRISELTHEERSKLIETNSDYGEIICRCEHISKKEILDAYNNILGVRNLSGIKYRARAMMGRCQGGFCTAKIISILENELNVPIKNINHYGPGSNLFIGRVKGNRSWKNESD